MLNHSKTIRCVIYPYCAQCAMVPTLVENSNFVLCTCIYTCDLYIKLSVCPSAFFRRDAASSTTEAHINTEL